MEREFRNKEYYHVYNRGVDKRIIFKSKIEYFHFFELMLNVNQEESIGSIYRKKQNDNKDIKKMSEGLVEILAYSLLPNHYHFLLKQISENGISKFMHKMGTGYTNFFNYRHKRSGALFQGPFKSIHVTSEEYLNYVSAYINGNIEIHNLYKAVNYKYSGYKYFLDGKKVFSYENILSNFGSIKEYKNFVSEVIRNSKKSKDDRYLYNLE